MWVWLRIISFPQALEQAKGLIEGRADMSEVGYLVEEMQVQGNSKASQNMHCLVKGSH